MKLHDILHELVDAASTFTDNRRGELHAAISKLEELAHEPEPGREAQAQDTVAAGDAPGSPAE